MKKLFIIFAVLILGTMATWAQNGLSFTIYPEASGPFTIWYSTYNAPASNAVQVKWDNLTLSAYNTTASTGTNPSVKIQGSVIKGTPIKIYSDCIDAIHIDSKAMSIRCESNNPQLEYIYYFENNLTPDYLELLYSSLRDRTGKDWGELHLSKNPAIESIGDNILKSNAFITLDRHWYVCSMKLWIGSFDNRIYYKIDETAAKSNLIPAIQLNTKSTANITDLQLGVMATAGNLYNINGFNIRIEDGTNNHKQVQLLKYDTNALFESNAPKLTVKGIPSSSGSIKIYGAFVSHIKTNSGQISGVVNIGQTNNLRYLNLTNSNQFTDFNGLINQPLLEELHLENCPSLKNANTANSSQLKILNVNGCTELTSLAYNLTNLETLKISNCVKLSSTFFSLLTDAKKIKKLEVVRLGKNACEMDALYGNLSSTPPSGAQIWVEDANGSGEANKFDQSNKTIATNKGWLVVEKRLDGTGYAITGDGGGCLKVVPSLSFTIRPNSSGSFSIWYSTKNATKYNAVLVDWGDGELLSYEASNEGGSNPNKQISGNVTLGKAIKVYSNFIEALLISSAAESIVFSTNNQNLEYFYYTRGNLSSEALEHLYMSLNNRGGKNWGELHLTVETTVATASDNILKSNAFIAIDKHWLVCSRKEWVGDFQTRTYWFMDENSAKANLIPAITLQTPTTADITDLQLGINERPEYPYNVATSLIRIDDGTTNHKSVSASRYATNSEFSINAPKLTVKGTDATSSIKIYGALVSHIKTEQISALDLSRTSNLRGLNVMNCNKLTDIPGLKAQTLLEVLNLNNNISLTGLNLEDSRKLISLSVVGCKKLAYLFFRTNSLESLAFKQCIKLDYSTFGNLDDAPKLTNIRAGNIGWDFTIMNFLYKNLTSPAPSGAKIYVEDAELGGVNSNDWECSNKTIATAKGWMVIREYNAGSEQLLLDDGSECHLGISEVDDAKLITVYPNPATDVVKVTINQTLNAQSLQVIDFTGKTIYTVPINSSALEHQINVSDYIKGIYLIRAGNITRKLVVK